MTQNFVNSMNANCSCDTLNLSKLRNYESTNGALGSVSHQASKFFSFKPTFITMKSSELILGLLESLKRILSNPKIREYLFQNGMFPILRDKEITGGIFLSLDFHDSLDGPKLIEINTNAGGVYLNYLLLYSQDPCCDSMNSTLPRMDDRLNFEDKIFSYFEKEWNIQRIEIPEFQEKRFENSTIAILDSNPKQQFLYEEFILFQNLFQRKGLKCFIVSPEELEHRNSGIFFQDERIDFIYNRHTDFLFQETKMQILNEAWKNNQVVISPNSQDYLLYAKKSNLSLFSNETYLKSCGIASKDIETIRSILPKSELLNDSNHEFYWENRKDYFFKPSQSYGGKGSYSGKKISRKKFDEIISFDYIAQEFVAPSNRTFEVEGVTLDFKTDFRAYIYDSEIFLLTSRLYQGQVTNFRTNGGGFSPVILIPQIEKNQNSEEKC